MRPAEATQWEPLGAGSMPGGERDLAGPGGCGVLGRHPLQVLLVR